MHLQNVRVLDLRGRLNSSKEYASMARSRHVEEAIYFEFDAT